MSNLPSIKARVFPCNALAWQTKRNLWHIQRRYCALKVNVAYGTIFVCLEHQHNSLSRLFGYQRIWYESKSVNNKKFLFHTLHIRKKWQPVRYVNGCKCLGEVGKYSYCISFETLLLSWQSHGLVVAPWTSLERLPSSRRLLCCVPKE